MCGINIIVNTSGKPIEEPLTAMQQATVFRGPDASHIFTHKSDNWQVAVGVNRLQVVDSDSNSNQPMVSSCGNYILAYNGEVYNYQDLKNKLLSRGYTFTTHSDTEVVLYWLQEFGVPGLADLKGMFALTFISLLEKTVVAARDKQGIKPLFVSVTKSQLIISSSIQAIEACGLVDLSLNRSAIEDYLSYRHVMGTKTFYNEVESHQPGLVIQYDTQFNKTLSVVEEVSDNKTKDLKQTLIDSIILLNTAPSSPGLLLSGGVDSTLLLAILRNELGLHGVNTYTLAVGEDQKWAKKAAGQYNSHHHEVPVVIEDLLRVDDFLANTDQPIADSGAFATWLISAEVKKDGNVLLSGAGADELFAGYNRHRAYNYYLHHPKQLLNIKNIGRKICLLGLLPKSLQQLLRAVEEDPVSTYNNFLQSHGIIKNKLSGSLWKDTGLPFDHLAQALEFDHHNYLVADVLAITDNATMQNSVEARVPYLYDDVVKLAGQITASKKIKNRGKGPLKDLLTNYGGIKYCQRKKYGFGLPLAAWFRDKRSWWLWEFLTHDAPIFEFLPKSEIYQILRLHQSAKKDNSMQLWSILVLEKWLSRIS